MAWGARDRREADREIRAFTRDWTARDDRIASLSYFGTFAAYFFTLWLAVQAWPSGGSWCR
jgi:omega-6 fatty acid desaturase (delta-12 desaturase)